jgi:hypothetical protein
MARAKKKKPARIREPWSDVKPIALQVRGSAEWKAWVGKLADTNRQSVAGMVDQALAYWAQKTGFTSPPER